jgi:hypothetical protein
MTMSSVYSTYSADDMRILGTEFQPDPIWSIPELVSGRVKLDQFQIVGKGPEKEFVRAMKLRQLNRFDALLEFRRKQFQSKRDETLALLKLLSSQDSYIETIVIKESLQGHTIGAGLAAANSDQEVFLAAQKDRFAFDLALSICDIRLSIQRGKNENALSDEVVDFLRGVVSGRIKRPKQTGPHPAANMLRDAQICALVETSGLNGLQIYRNDASDHTDTALDVVAEFCKSIGSKIQSYRRVKEIWESRHSSGREFRDYLRP